MPLRPSLNRKGTHPARLSAPTVTALVLARFGSANIAMMVGNMPIPNNTAYGMNTAARITRPIMNTETFAPPLDLPAAFFTGFFTAFRRGGGFGDLALFSPEFFYLPCPSPSMSDV
jgi:hypothetical protein